MRLVKALFSIYGSVYLVTLQLDLRGLTEVMIPSNLMCFFEIFVKTLSIAIYVVLHTLVGKFI